MENIENIETKSLISVSSYVAHGYVGNRSVVFPLQCLGWDVDAINTTDYSNHPGYGTFSGSKADPEHIEKLFDGLGKIRNPTDPYKMALIGYCPSAAILKVACRNIEQIHIDHSDMFVVVDPVLGDNGRLYVSEDVVPVYKEFLKSKCVSLVTPNQFELELLTGKKIDSWSTAYEALETFHSTYDVPNIVLSSIVIDGEMGAVGFSQTSEETDPQTFKVPIDQIGCSFNGCGDVFAALLAHGFYMNRGELNKAVLETAVVKMTKILKISYAVEQKKTGEPPTVVKDIALVASRHIFREK